MNDNLPDDCQGNGKHLPWNQEDELHVCQECSEQLEESDNHNEIKTRRGVDEYLCDECVEWNNAFPHYEMA